ncbi:MAG: ABC transporter permease [Clostridia bacterium]
MLMEVKNNIRYFFDALKVSIKSAMAYKVSFIIQTVFMFINNIFFLIFWAVVFSKTGNNTDITFNNVLYLWSFSALSYGIAYFFFAGVQKINDYIITGAMDSFLLQPKNILLNVATSKCSFSACGDLIYGIVIGAIAAGGDVGKIILLILIAAFGSVFFISTEVIFRAISVWIGDTHSIANRYIEMLLITFSTYPENIFRTGIKIILYTVVPVAYLAYMPASILETFNIWKLLLILIVGTIYMFIAIKVFYKAMKSYESGNSMAMKN